MSRDEAIMCLYRASAALGTARQHTDDPVLNERIRDLAEEILHLIGLLATGRTAPAVTS
jgi:hypothetical protein